jgi:hypothetical protein
MPLRCSIITAQNQNSQLFKSNKMRLFKFLLIATLMFAIQSVNAQTVSPVFFRTTSNTMYNYSYEGTLRTTDSTTYHTVGTLAISNNEAGIIEVEVVGLDTTSTAGFVVGKQIVNYSKKAGTLTLATPTNVLSATTSVSLITSAFQVTTASNNIVVQVKGTLIPGQFYGP